MSDQILGEVGPDEQKKRLSAAIHAQLDARVAEAEARMLGEIAEEIGNRELPQRDGLKFLNRDGEEVIKQTSPTLPLYRHMPEEVRKLRNPDSDHWYAEFFRGIAQSDKPMWMQASAKIAAMYPHMRADLLEGASSTTGGFAAGTGGVYLPRPLEALVAVARDRTAKLWRYATTYQMTTQSHNIPTGGAITAYMQDEATTPTTTGWTTAQVPLIAYNAIAKAILGNDMMADSAVNLVSFITQRGGNALGVLEDAEFFKAGTGTAPHVTKLSGTAYAEGTTNALKYSDVVAMWFNVAQEYRQNARWFIASDVLKFMAGVVDGNSRPLYASLLDPPKVLSDTPTGAPDTGAEGTLLGKPVHDVALTAGDIWFGDPAATYAIGRREGVTIEVSREFLFDTRRTMFLMRQRIAGNNIETVSAQIASGITSATV